MSGMLGRMGALGSMAPGMEQLDPSFLMALLGAQRKDPFTRPMPGEGLLGPGGMAMPEHPQGMQPSPMGGPQAGMNEPQVPGMNTISTDFQDTQPGLPNLPDSFQGFGYGQFAPKESQGMAGAMKGPGAGLDNDGVRQQLIRDMMRQLLPQLAAGGIGLGQGMGGF